MDKMKRVFAKADHTKKLSERERSHRRKLIWYKVKSTLVHYVEVGKY